MIFENGEQLVRLWLCQRLFDCARQHFVRKLEVVLFDRDRCEVEQRERLIGFFAKGGLQMSAGLVEISLCQLEAAKIDQDSRRVAAVGNCPFKKCALVFPVESADKRARAEKNDP